MPICNLDEKGYCERHKKIHTGRELEVSQQDTDDAEKYRFYWDTKVDKPVSFLQKAANFVDATIKHASAGFQTTTDAQYEERLSICDKCEFCDKSNESWKCKRCGCFLNVKARWREQDCPLRLWPKLITKQSGGCGCGS